MSSHVYKFLSHILFGQRTILDKKINCKTNDWTLCPNSNNNLSWYGPSDAIDTIGFTRDKFTNCEKDLE